MRDSEIVFHNKHGSGQSLIDWYTKDNFREPKDFASWVHMSMVMQAYGIGIRIHATRRAMPYSMGSLYWQLNDAWPAFSWSSLDFYGQWKALHFRARELYATVGVYIHGGGSWKRTKILNADLVRVSIVNDNRHGIEGDFYLELLTFEGRSVARLQDRIKIPKVKKQDFDFTFDGVNIDSKTMYVRAKYTLTDGKVYEAV